MPLYFWTKLKSSSQSYASCALADSCCLDSSLLCHVSCVRLCHFWTTIDIPMFWHVQEVLVFPMLHMNNSPCLLENWCGMCNNVNVIDASGVFIHVICVVVHAPWDQLCEAFSIVLRSLYLALSLMLGYQMASSVIIHWHAPRCVCVHGQVEIIDSGSLRLEPQ